jgi:hypothetical protein
MLDSIVQDQQHYQSSCAISLRYQSVLSIRGGGALTCEIIKDSRLRGRARSAPLDTASRG